VILIMPRGVVPAVTDLVKRRRLKAMVPRPDAEQQLAGVAG
jgi:hypothetical protein